MTEDKIRPKEATLNDVLEALQGIQNKLDEISVWHKISGSSKVRELLVTTLNTSEKRLVYHLSDGKSTKEIVEASEVGAGTVNGYWKTWKNLGLMKTLKVKGGERSIRIFDLEDFNIDIPKIDSKQKSTTPQQQQALTEVIQEVQKSEKQ